MLQVVLAQQILPVVVAVGRSDDGVDVCAGRQVRIHQVAKTDRPLVIELDQDDGTLNAVVEHAAGRRPSNPRHPRPVQEGPDFVHSHPRVCLVDVIDVKGNQVDFVVINKGKASAPMTVDLKKVVPRVFTAFGTGSGQAAAVNKSGVLNGGAAPASVGSYLSFWVTGLADTSDPEFDPAAIAEDADPLPFPIRVYIGGQQQILLYAGTAPGMLEAVTQINIQIAPDTPKGKQPILIVVGAEESPETTTVVVE